MASLTRGVSFRRQGSSGRSWADSLVLGEQHVVPQRFSRPQGKGDGITKKTIMAPDDHSDVIKDSASQLKMNRSTSPRGGDARKSRHGGVFGWLKSRFRKIGS